MEAITIDCDDILTFLQLIMVKSPRVAASPVSLRSEKLNREKFQGLSSHNLAPLSLTHPAAPQDYSGLTGVMSDVATYLKNVEAFFLVIALQRESG